MSAALYHGSGVTRARGSRKPEMDLAFHFTFFVTQNFKIPPLSLDRFGVFILTLGHTILQLLYPMFAVISVSANMKSRCFLDVCFPMFSCFRYPVTLVTEISSEARKKS